ncbi:hypothetical protein [Enterobacter oligotrophicus]|uniref:hypothetical protein n=1 Tax=Enterobacter oligotrophicus TaxID=2478464 RepID=UPI0023F2F6C3|nr:hypothetical protein [Enterobacter oligotrophicus]
MSLNNVKKYMLLIVLLCGASGLPALAQADDGDCEMMSAVKKVDYGRYRKEDMRQTSAEHVGKVYNGYASVTRELQVSVMCPDARKMRITVDGAARQNMAYRFTDKGAMKIELKMAGSTAVRYSWLTSISGRSPFRTGPRRSR